MSENALMPAAECRWRMGGQGADGAAEVLALLGALERCDSIAAAAREAGMSYRKAWGLLTGWAARIGMPLVVMERGRGTRLTPLAERMLEIDRRLRERAAPALQAASREMRTLFAEGAAVSARPVTVHASHDLALALLRELPERQGLAMDLQFRGSEESLADFAAGRCDMAGFHCPEGDLGRTLWQQYRRYLRPRAHELLRLARRAQGLMVGAGNPRRLRGIADLARSGVRFINRQPGSGTRLLLDLLLREAGIAPERVAGYGAEEYTHAAVAATVASGQADVGLGVEAAARRFGLDFIRLVTEQYFLVLRRDRATEPGIRELLAVLRSEAFRQRVRALPGYDPRQSGSRVRAAP